MVQRNRHLKLSLISVRIAIILLFVAEAVPDAVDRSTIQSSDPINLVGDTDTGYRLFASTNYAGALQNFEASLHAFQHQHGPASEESGQSNSTELARIYLGLAQTLVQLDSFAPAINFYEQLLRLDMDDITQEAVLKGAGLAGYTVALTKVQRFKQVCVAAHRRM